MEAEKHEVSSMDDLPEALRRLLTFEQRNLWKPERLRAAPVDPGFDMHYLPENGVTITLPCFWVQSRFLYIYGEWERTDRVLFPIHPLALPSYKEFLRQVGAVDAARDGLLVQATPTSSVRTVFAWGNKGVRPSFVKLSLECNLIGDRRLQRRVVARSIGLSDLLQSCQGVQPFGMRYFYEPLGMVPRIMQDAGVLFRQVPDELANGSVTIAPLFALMGESEGYRPLLVEFVERARRDPIEVVEPALLAGFAKIWVQLVFEWGLIVEAHGQDLLVAISRGGEWYEGFYYRDFEGLAVDWGLRAKKGLQAPEFLPNSANWFDTYETWGHPLYQLVSIKMKTSLFDYVHLVLRELEVALMKWQASGVMGGARIRRGELTCLFSRYLRRAIREKFGLKEAREYDILDNLNRFGLFLMRVRREVLNSCV